MPACAITLAANLSSVNFSLWLYTNKWLGESCWEDRGWSVAINHPN